MIEVRQARMTDLRDIVAMLASDELGEHREAIEHPMNRAYIRAFEEIEADANQMLIVAELEGQVVGALQISIIPGLARAGMTRGQLEAIRISREHRGEGIGARLIHVRRILNLAARVWRDENGLSWLSAPPLILMLPKQGRKPYPLSWEEQGRLFDQFPDHLRQMALFKVNTGLRQNEVCRLRWDWEVRVPELDTTLFIIPEWLAKNGEERIVVLNEIARGVIARQRGRHAVFVFSYRGEPVQRIMGGAWRRARARVGLPRARVHDLKHTFGHRLRAAGVAFEDRQDLLGHRSGRITTHYSAPDVKRLIEAAERVSRPVLQTILRVESHANLTQTQSTRRPALPKLVVK